MPSSFKECLTHAGMGHLNEKVQAHIDAGIPEKEAVRKVLLDEHQKLHDDLNDLRKKVKVPTEPFIPHDNSQKIKEINDEYDKKIAEVPIQAEATQPATTEPNQVSQPATESAEKPPTGTGGEPEAEVSKGGNKIGVHHAALTDLAKELGLPEPGRSDYVSPEEYAERGRKLVDAGASIDEIDNKSNELHDRISIGRAYLEKYYNELNEIRKSKGVGSEQYKAKLSDINSLSEKVKKLGSKAGQSMTSLQGTRDSDTDNFEVVKNSVEQSQKRPIGQYQEKKIEQLTSQNEELKKRAEDSEAKLIEETNKRINTEEQEPKKTISQKAKSTADRIRKAAKLHRPGSFSAGTPASIVWDAAVETVAKSIEAGGEIAEAIQKGIKHIQESKWYKSLTDGEKKKSEEDFVKWHKEKTAPLDSSIESLWNRFADKEDTDFTKEESRAIWGYAKKSYLDKGVKYKDMIGNVANDTGLSWRQVSAAITPKYDKYLKSVSDQMWKTRSVRLKNQQATKDWVEAQTKNKLVKGWKKLSGAIRGEFVFGHGGIFLGTHAAGTLFQPKLWKYLFPAYLRGWKFAYGNVGNYEREMAEFKSRPLYLKFQKAGLQNDVDNYNAEELQNSQKFLGKLAGAGQRGFNAIKVFRQDWAEMEYNKLSEREKSDPSSLEHIVKLVNNGTGATNVKVGPVAREFMFAPGMELARWARLITNPMKATGYSLEWLYKSTIGKGEMTPSQKVFVKTWAKRTGWAVGTYTGALLANAAIQNTINPKNPVNLTAPSKPDYLAFKFGDVTINATGGLLSAFNLIRGIVHIAGESKKELRGDNPFVAEAKKIGGYARGKFAPAYSIAVDFLARQDYDREVMPTSNEKPAPGKHKMSWIEYGAKHLPLPLAETAGSIYNSALDNVGQDNRSLLDKVMTAIVAGTISAATGLRTGEYDTELNKKPSPYTDEDKKDKRVSWVYNDWKMELPNTVASSENITDEDKATKIMLDKYPKETQDKYMKQHNEELFNVLGDIHSNGTVFVKKYKDEEGNPKNEVLLNVPKSGDYDEKSLDKLDESERKQVLRLAQQEATKKTKKDLFNQ